MLSKITKLLRLKTNRINIQILHDGIHGIFKCYVYTTKVVDKNM
jgi:hypothetical protein